MTNKTILLDIMVGGRFYTQLRYTEHGTPQMVNGVITEVHKTSDIEAFVHKKLPSLNKKNFQIGFATRQVFVR